MSRIICFATGSIWRWAKNRGDLLKYLKGLEVEGVELTMGHIEEFYKFRLLPKDVSWLRDMDRVSIHAPFRMLRDAKDMAEVLDQLEKLETLYKITKAQQVVIHPPDLPSPEVLSSYNFEVSTENLPINRAITVGKLQTIMGRYPEIGFCLDVGHAYSWGRYETGRLLKAFKDRITQVHLHGCYRKKDHLSLKKVSKAYMKSLEPIRELKVPFVIEEDIIFKDASKLAQEVEYVRTVFEQNKNFIYLR